MSLIEGKYKLVENKNIYEFLTGIGIPEDKAKEGNEIKGTVVVSLNGKKFQMDSDDPPRTTKLILDEEVEEPMPGFVSYSTTKLDGNVLTITMKSKEGQGVGSRVYTFTKGGMEVVITGLKDGKTFSGTRIYKRI